MKRTNIVERRKEKHKWNNKKKENKRW